LCLPLILINDNSANYSMIPEEKRYSFCLRQNENSKHLLGLIFCFQMSVYSFENRYISLYLEALQQPRDALSSTEMYLANHANFHSPLLHLKGWEN
ncbi:MAG TPA: hypothetical protein DCZ88_00245, partial [Pseudanabaena sp.]|nr:hypothetical protein [Pseudanabaena sp.]